MIAEARGRQDLVILVAGAAVGLDVSELDGPAQVRRRKAFSLEKVDGKGLQHVGAGAGENFEERGDGPDLVAVAKADRVRRIGFEFAGRGIDPQGFAGADAAIAERILDNEIVVLQRFRR